MCLKRDEFRSDFKRCERDLGELYGLRSYLVSADNVFEKEQKLISLGRKIGELVRTLADLRYILSRPCSYDGCC